MLETLFIYHSEPAPKWTAYCAYNVFLDTQGLVSKQKLASEPVALNVLLASSTSMIYSWHVSVADLLNLDEKPGGWERDKKKEASMFPPSHLVGVIELPLKVLLLLFIVVLDYWQCRITMQLSQSANVNCGSSLRHYLMYI